MKKALMPLLIIVGVIVILMIAAHWYEQKYGSEGPFESQHHH